MLTERGGVDPDKLQPVTRLGDILYATLGGGFRIPRPPWAGNAEKVLKMNEAAAGTAQ